MEDIKPTTPKMPTAISFGFELFKIRTALIANTRPATEVPRIIRFKSISSTLVKLEKASLNTGKPIRSVIGIISG